MDSPTTACERTLATPELTKIILTYVDDTSKASSVRVCKLWADICIPIIWETVSSIDMLTHILTLGEDDYYPRSTDWARFEGYAKYVRTFEVDDNTIMEDFPMLVATRPQQSILPNLRKLVWSSDNIEELVKYSVIFMTGGITDFKLTLPKIESDGIAHFNAYADCIGSRMPFLQHLEIVQFAKVADVETGLHDLLSSCRFPVTITLPKYWITSRIFEVLAGTTIKTIKSNDCGVRGGNAFAPSLVNIPNPFSALTDITLHIPYHEMILLLTSPSFPITPPPFPMIQRIQVISSENSSRSEVSLLADVLSKRFPDMLELNIGVVAVSHNHFDETPEVGIILADLKPLFVMSKLEKFTISNHFPLNFTDEDMGTFASNFPAIQCLYMNETPSCRLDSGLSWKALYLISTKCPLLRELGLYMRLGPSRLKFSGPNLVHRLHFLKLFSVGFTPISEEVYISTGVLLSFILPPGCQLAYDDKDDDVPWSLVEKGLPTMWEYADMFYSRIPEEKWQCYLE